MKTLNDIAKGVATKWKVRAKRDRKNRAAIRKKWEKFFLTSTLAVFLLAGCRTASRALEKHRESVESLEVKKKDLELKNDSVAQESTYKFTEEEFQKLISRINFNFNGKKNQDSAIIEIIQGEGIISMKVIGLADLTFDSELNKEKNSKSETNQSEGEIHQNKKEKSEVVTKKESGKETIDKNIESKTTGFQFSFWMWVIIGTIVIICLWWFFGRPKGMKE